MIAGRTRIRGIGTTVCFCFAGLTMTVIAGDVTGSCPGVTGVGCQEADQSGHGPGNSVGAASISSPGSAVADSFQPSAGGAITSVCWWGFYLDTFKLADCSPGTGDDFTITYYEDDGSGAAPGVPRGGPFPVGIAGGGPTGATIPSIFGNLNEYSYSANHPPVPVSAGECLWVEITNATFGSCSWFWSSAPPGDGIAAQNGPFWSEIDFDLAWCVDLPTTNVGCAGLLNDECSGAEPIAGEGFFPFDSTTATPGGPDHQLCDANSTPIIGPDVWFRWTASCDGMAVVETCGSPLDTRLAVYEGGGCPVDDAGLLACNDNACDVQSIVTFAAVAGSDYLLRVGTFPDAPGGPGKLLISCEPPPGVQFVEPAEFPADGEAINEAVGDLDNDGDVDVVVIIVPPPGPPPGPAATTGGAVQVFRNLGARGGAAWNGLVALPPISTGNGTNDVTVGDFNDDTYLDIAVSNGRDGTVVVLLNDGTGNATFDPPFTVYTGTEPTSIAAALLDGDLLPDLAITDDGPDTALVLFNDGSPGTTFTPGTPRLVQLDPGSIEPGDFDEDKRPDGDTDLVIANAGSDSVSLLLNDGLGGIGPAANSTTGDEPVDLSLADVVQDGLLDVVSVNMSSDTVTILSNNGSGGLGTFGAVQVGDMPASIEAADLSNDGASDLAVVADDPVIGPAVQVLTSIGSGVFTPPVGFDVMATPRYVRSADFNGDGLLDLVTANSDTSPGGGSVTVLLNAICDADVDGSGVVDVDDLVDVIIAWGTTGPNEDVNDDGIVNVDDLVEVILRWGPCPAFVPGP